MEINIPRRGEKTPNTEKGMFSFLKRKQAKQSKEKNNLKRVIDDLRKEGNKLLYDTYLSKTTDEATGNAAYEEYGENREIFFNLVESSPKEAKRFLTKLKQETNDE